MNTNIGSQRLPHPNEDRSRSQSLIDISDQAREAGIELPVAVSRGVDQLVRLSTKQNGSELLRSRGLTPGYYAIAWMLRAHVVAYVIAGGTPCANEPYEFVSQVGQRERTLIAVLRWDGQPGTSSVVVMLPEEYEP